MKTGIELISEERARQVNKLGKTLQHDLEFNDDSQLTKAASFLCVEDYGCLTSEFITERYCPEGWDDTWGKMVAKPYKERLIIAGALIAAELDRLSALEKEQLK